MGKVLFTDEKLFTIEQSHNHQNDRCWASEAPQCSKVITHRQNAQSVMVWAGICSTGKTPLVFTDKGVKINQEISSSETLEAVVLPWTQQHFPNQHLIFQQDSAPCLLYTSPSPRD